jgi:hypothetical protein
MESNIASHRGLSSGVTSEISVKLHWLIEMMEANQMLLGTVRRNCVGSLPQIQNSSPKIEELHLSAPKLNAAQQNSGVDELAPSIERAVIKSHSQFDSNQRQDQNNRPYFVWVAVIVV